MMSDGHLEAPSDCVVLFDHQDSIQQAAAAVAELVPSDVESDRIEPPAKRAREDEVFTETITIDWNDDNVKQTLYNVNRALSLRLEELENKYEMLLRTVGQLSKKVQQVEEKAVPVTMRGRGTPVVVGLPQSAASGVPPIKNAGIAPGSNVQLITLNTEDDFPTGVWLGDENNPELRVRVAVTPSDLLHIHSNCRTPEKMALTLLDYLFDRDTQAISNLSGTGKHGKKQLDPLKIYGIRCHLIHRFGISDPVWHRIRLNIDSKCRTAYRRKIKGQSMAVKGFKDDDKDVNEYITYTTTGIHDDDGELSIQEGVSLDGNGGLQIIHATEEQLAQLQQSHQIHILDDGQVPAELLQQLQSQPGTVVATSAADSDGRIQISVSGLEGTAGVVSHPTVEYDDPSDQLQVHEHEIGEDGTDVVSAVANHLS